MAMRRRLLLVVLVVTGFAVTDASADVTTLPSAPPGPAVNTAQTQAPEAGSDVDPIEGFNRKMFWFNDHVDMYVLEPVAKGWDFVLPTRAETCVQNFFLNLRFPIDTANDLFQTKWKYAGKQVARFLVNTTAGVAGFFDPATSLGLEAHPEDFGQTLGYWGVSPGAYLVLPLLGPATLRDGAGMIVDYPLAVTPFFVDWYYLLGARVVDTVNTRAIYLDPIRQAKEASFDYYAFVRSAYLQRRQALVSDFATPSAESNEELYHPQD